MNQKTRPSCICGNRGYSALINDEHFAECPNSIPAMNQNTETWQERFSKRFAGQTELSQAILGALAYRGFDDAGKYLDESIAECIIPVIVEFVRTELDRARQEGRDEAVNYIQKNLVGSAAFLEHDDGILEAARQHKEG